jgi:hypothetical protein
MRPPGGARLVAFDFMADDTTTKRPEELDTRRLEQLSRIVAWTEPKPKPDTAGPGEEARDAS